MKNDEIKVKKEEQQNYHRYKLVEQWHIWLLSGKMTYKLMIIPPLLALFLIFPLS